MKTDALQLKPFIPSGQDFSASLTFFTDLGFKENWRVEGLAELQAGEAVFLLQAFHNRELQENLMMVLVVPDLDRWYEAAMATGVFNRFEGTSIGKPELFPWGNREVHFIDPAGVCWHVMGR